ncbi:3217_t:CDS:1, partial [Ambispora gerdemannii]
MLAQILNSFSNHDKSRSTIGTFQYLNTEQEVTIQELIDMFPFEDSLMLCEFININASLITNELMTNEIIVEAIHESVEKEEEFEIIIPVTNTTAV